MDNYSIFLHNIKSDKNKADFCYYVDPPPPPPTVEWYSTYLFTAVLVHVRVTPMTKGPPAQIFWRWHVFCSPGHYFLFLL